MKGVNMTEKAERKPQDWSRYPYPSLEEDFENLISDEMDCKWEDNGIGAYEFWGSKEVDTRMEYNIETDDATIYVQLNGDDYLPMVITGKWSDRQDEYDERGEVEWKATLCTAEWESSLISEKENPYKHYKCVYSIEETN
jgi:hypothetical protein